MEDSTQTSVLNAYLEEISHIPLLTPQEETELMKKMKEGDNQARMRFIEGNLRLVAWFTKKYKASNIPMEDIISEANIILMKAVDTFDPDKGIKFSTYATTLISNNLIRYFSKHERLISIPEYQYLNLQHYKRAYHTLTQQNGVNPSVKEVAEYLEIPLSQAEELRNLLYPIVSINGIDDISSDSEEMSYVEMLDYFTDDTIHIESDLEEKLLPSEVMELYEKATLTNREREIMALRLGLYDGIPRSLRKIASILEQKAGIESIRQTELSAIRKLRSGLFRYVLEIYMDDSSSLLSRKDVLFKLLEESRKEEIKIARTNIAKEKKYLQAYSMEEGAILALCNGYLEQEKYTLEEVSTILGMNIEQVEEIIENIQEKELESTKKKGKTKTKRLSKR